MSYGDPNQHYSSNFFEQISGKSNETTHLVFASNIFKNKNKVKVLSIGTIDGLEMGFTTLKFLFKTLFFDDEFKDVTKKFKLKQKIKFALKWKYLLKSNIDIIHIHHFQTVSETILKYFKLKGIPVVISFRGTDLIIRSEDEDFYNKIKYVSHIHTISYYMKSLFKDKSLNIPVSVIYRSIDKNPSVQIVTQNDTDITRIISVGRLVWIKGHFYLLDALYNLKKEGFNFCLDIYGEGDLRSFYEFRIKQLGLEANVFLKGFIDNNLLKEEYESYDLAIQPSFYEALSNGLLDLISHNIPCVISNQGGMMELIEPGVNGEVFDINQPNTLEKAILRCLNLDKNIVANFNSSFLDGFSSEVELDKFEKLYNSLI
tara:strand:- start:54 stop:1169 length:1116 start_codon:yes stop_codon:yes gene_type:complete